MMRDALLTIISKSDRATPHAVKTMKALNAESPILQQRYQMTVEVAFDDPNAEFTDEERQRIVQYLNVIDHETRSKIVQVRVTPTERADLEIMAEEAGFGGDVSAWTRRLWGLE